EEILRILACASGSSRPVCACPKRNRPLFLERRDSFMPTRAPSVYRPWCLAVALCLVAGTAPRTSAKPPDLPQPTDFEFAPGASGQNNAPQMLVPAEWLPEEEAEAPGLSPADRCAAMRTATRCILFGLNPLASFLRADRCLEYDDTPSAPVLRVGDYE